MKKVIPLMAMTAFSLPVMATEPGTFYGALGGGAYQIDSSGFDETAPSANVLGGYNLSERFAIEGAYTRLFDAEGKVDNIGVEISGNVWELSTKMTVPVGNRFNSYGRLGWSYLDLKAVTVSNEFPGRANGYDDAFTWAMRAGYELKPRLSLNGEYGQIQIDGGDLERLSFSLNYQFGSH